MAQTANSESASADSFSSCLAQLPSSSSTQLPVLLYLSFTRETNFFVAGTDSGFWLYQCDPFNEIIRKDFDSGGGIGLVQMLFDNRVFAMVGGGPTPNYSTDKVMIWDNRGREFISVLSFPSEVKGVRLRRDKSIIVITLRKVFVYNFQDLELLLELETMDNPKGLCEVSYDSGPMVLVCLGLEDGQVRIDFGSKQTKFIMAHESKLACFALTLDGSFLATASCRGTLVRVFSTSDGTLLQDVRRGADKAEIYSLAFSSKAHWLAVSSDRGTIHVFSLKVNSDSSVASRSQDNSKSLISNPSFLSSHSFIRGALPRYFSSEWSFAQFHTPKGLRCIVSFGQQTNTIAIVGMDGSFYRCEFDPESGGEMTQLEYHNLLNPEETF